MTNEQLAMALISTFKHFGQILSVKASRDIRGRPFGFVDFAVKTQCYRYIYLPVLFSLGPEWCEECVGSGSVHSH